MNEFGLDFWPEIWHVAVVTVPGIDLTESWTFGGVQHMSDAH